MTKPPTSSGATPRDASARPVTGRALARQRLILLGILAVCAAPLVAALLMYYVFSPPGARTNQGELIDPQRPLPALRLATLAGDPYPAEQLKGHWQMVTIDSAACDAHCAAKLHLIRQTRQAQGKQRDRVGQLWLVSDSAPVSPQLASAYDATLMLRADPAELARLFPPASGSRIEDHVYLIDPLGNLMMRFPRDPDPRGVHKDLARLLRASRIG